LRAVKPISLPSSLRLASS